jgi:hypothetical protein
MYTGDIKRTIMHRMMMFLKGQNMANAKTTTTPTKIDVDAVYAGLEVYTKSVLKNEKDTVKMLDILIAANVPETHLVSPIQGPNKHLSTATPEFFQGLKYAIEAQYPREVHALMELSSKAAGNTYVGTNNRDGWKKKANSVIGGMRTAYINRLKRQGDIASGKQGADTRTKTVEIALSESAVFMIKKIQKAETVKTTMDLDVMVSQLKAIVKSFD